MRKAIVLSIFCVFGYLSLNAQIQLGVTGGIDYTFINIKRENPTAIGIQGIPGYHFGIILKQPLKENFNITADLIFARRGYKQSIRLPIPRIGEFQDSLTTFNVSSYYFEIPVLMEFKAQFDKMNIISGIGPYVSYGIGGKVNLTIDSPSTNFSYSERIRWKPYFDPSEEVGVKTISDYGYSKVKRLDYGLITRFGVQLKSVTLNAEYKYGLANLIWEFRRYEKMNNQSIGLSITYTFNKKVK